MVIKSQRDYMPLFLEKIASGNYLVPKFQRDFVWSTKQIIELFDSILKGFPIGSIIMWKPSEERFDTIKEVGGIIVNSNQSDISYILDGRQRVTAMVSVLYKDGNLSDCYYIDLEDFSVIKHTRGEKPASFIKLSDAFDSWYVVEYIESIKNTLPEDKVRQYTESAKKVNKTLLSYEIGYITVYGGKIDDAVEIFSRLNSKGIDISADYMIQALTYNDKTGFLFSDKVKEIIDQLIPYNFDSISRDTILKCIYNYTSKPFIDAKTEDIINMKNLPKVVESVKTDLIYTVRFLYSNCGVKDIVLLPYIYQLVMLAMFFKENKEPTDRQQSQLRHWFLYTSYTNYFTNTSLANIRQDILLFKKYCKGQADNPMALNVSRVYIDQFPDYLRLSAVRSCSLILTTLLPPLLRDGRYRKMGFFIPQGLQKERRPGNSICFVNDCQRNHLRQLFQKKIKWDPSCERFFLNEECMSAYFSGDYKTFVRLRKKLIKDTEKDIINKTINGISII